MSERRQNPCRPECERRTATCHGTCQQYKDWAQEERQRNRAIREARDKEARLNDYAVDTAERRRRTVNRRKR